MAYYDFEVALNRMLARVPAIRDKRQGAIIYDTLAPVAADFAQLDIVMTIMRDQVMLLTATGDNLDNLVVIHGMTRDQATRAVRIGEMKDQNGKPIDLPIGSRFSVPGGPSFVLMEHTDVVGTCLLECEIAGTIGNAYIGNILPLFVINNLGSALIVGTQTPGDDIETDDELRTRTIARLKNQPFGGNIADYKQLASEIDGLGAVKVFPVWNGGGTVMLSIVDSSYNPATPEFIASVQTQIDPVKNSGEGIGIAPIGHRVTVVTPNIEYVAVMANLTLDPGYAISQVQEPIVAAIEEYLDSLRYTWADSDTVSIFLARIAAAIIGVAGVANVTNILLNKSASDLILPQSPDSQKIPVFGGINLDYA